MPYNIAQNSRRESKYQELLISTGSEQEASKILRDRKKAGHDVFELDPHFGGLRSKEGVDMRDLAKAQKYGLSKDYDIEVAG